MTVEGRSKPRPYDGNRNRDLVFCVIRISRRSYARDNLLEYRRNPERNSIGGELPRILDVGCGPSKYPGAIGVDMNPQTAADVLCHLDRGRLPFADNSFDQIRAVHLIEHVEDPIATMEELHRVARPGGTIFVVTPHYSDLSSYTDPTHRRHLSSESFHYFYAGGLHGEEKWYTRARLRELHLRIRLLRLWSSLGFEFLVNHARWFRRFWEYYLSFVIRGKVMEFTFEVEK